MSALVEDLSPVTLDRGVSDAFASFVASDVEDDDDNLDEVLKVLDDDAQSPPSPTEVSSASENEGKLGYSSSDDGSSFHNSSESSDGKPRKKKNSKPRKRTAGMSVQEKREQRKIRNRELAAESRKRKNDEMDRLRKENAELKHKLDLLLRQHPTAQRESTVDAKVPVGAQIAKRTRVGTAIGTSVAVASLSVFVLTGPNENNAGMSTASVILTTLDSCEGNVAVHPSLGQFLFTLILAIGILSVLAGFGFRVIQASISSFPFRLGSASDQFALPKRVSSLTLASNGV